MPELQRTPHAHSSSIGISNLTVHHWRPQSYTQFFNTDDGRYRQAVNESVHLQQPYVFWVKALRENSPIPARSILRIVDASGRISVGKHVYRSADGRTIELLDRGHTQTCERLNAYPFKLSGGMPER
jgi:ABC-type dipeptide/oligopeptide/nickel transport system ATPase component